MQQIQLAAAPVRDLLVAERFTLPKLFKEDLRSRRAPWGFGSFSEVVFYRTYSRVMSDGRQERWADTIIRVVEGVLSIRKDWYRKHGLPWNEAYWQSLGREMANAIFAMKMLPPGRGLWAMGSDFVFERGSMALCNCGAYDVTDSLSRAAAWTMDALMNGTGVGFSTQNVTFDTLSQPGPETLTYAIPDNREGWVESVRLLIASYEAPGLPVAIFDYSQIRPAGQPIRGFGGIAAGPEPLQKLHDRLRVILSTYSEGELDQTQLITDVMNSIGVCVVAGNVRRSAELATGSIHDEVFLNLKNYDVYPRRAEWGWMSNNSVVLGHSEDFQSLPSIADRIRDNGEPGVINLINMQKYARVGKKKPDLANLFNPCAEIPLESAELCNLAEVFPARCDSVAEIWRVMELATIYASTVSLLPSHSPETNRVVARNRRIGVSVSGVADWLDATNLSHVTMILRKGYEEHVEPTNSRLAEEAGVPASIRLTTVKPSGTISLLAGVSPGVHWPVFRYGIRRIRISGSSPIVERLIEAGVPHEPDAYSDNTLVFEFPLESGNGKTRAVSEVSVWEQASLVIMLQREWADNAVSCTLTFSPSKEGDQIERVLAASAPLIKSMSLLPSQDEQKSYAQPPYESAPKDEYERRVRQIDPIEWDSFTGTDGQDSRYCDGDSCEIPFVNKEA